MENQGGNKKIMGKMFGMIVAMIGILPLLIGGIALIIFSKKLEKKDKEKQRAILNQPKNQLPKPKSTNPLVFSARVIDVQTQDTRTPEGYLSSRVYMITVEYEKNGELKVNTIRSMYDYPNGMEVEIKESGSIFGAYIIGNPPLGSNTRNKPENFVKGYIIARVAGIILTTISSAMYLAQIPFLSEYVAFLFFGGFASLPALLGFKLYKSAKQKQTDVNNGIYEKFDAKIVDIQIKHNDGHRYYYPLVEINYYDEILTPHLHQMDIHINHLGTIIPVYIHKETKEVLTEEQLGTSYIFPYILFGVSGFIWLLCILSALHII